MEEADLLLEILEGVAEAIMITEGRVEEATETAAPTRASPRN